MKPHAISSLEAVTALGRSAMPSHACAARAPAASEKSPSKNQSRRTASPHAVERPLHPRQAGMRQHVVGRAEDMADPAMPELDQMAHGQRRAALIVEADRRQPGAGAPLAGVDDGWPPAIGGGEEAIRQRAVERDDAVGPVVVQIVAQLAVARLRLLTVGNQHVEPFARGGSLDAGQHPREERVADVGHQHDDGARPLAAQIARRLVDPVAGALDRRHHGAARRLGHPVRRRQRPAHRRRRHLRLSRHVLDRRRPALVPRGARSRTRHRGEGNAA